MKNIEAREIILASIKEAGKITAQEINYKSKGKIPIIQINGIAKKLIDEKLIKLEQSDKTKYFLIGEKEIPDTSKKTDKENEDDNEPTIKPKVTESGRRDLSTYKFNGTEYKKGRLALAIVTHYAKEKRPTYKAAQEMFGDEIVPAYGFLRKVAEAKKASKERQRFFIKPEEVIKLRDCEICVSNQIGSGNIGKILAIARKELKYNIR